MKDTHNTMSPASTLAPAVYAATTKGSTVDLQGFGSAELVVNSGAIAGDGLYDVAIQHSDTTTDGDFIAVPEKYLIGDLPAALAEASTVRQGYVGGKRYVRAVITKQSGTSVAASAVIVRGHPSIAPTA